MTFLVLNYITNWINKDPSSGAFERNMELLKAQLDSVVGQFHPSGALDHIFIQFQYDLAGLPRAVKGSRVGRYSEKDCHIEAYVEVTREQFKNVPEEGRTSLLFGRLIDVLGQVRSKLGGKVDNNVEELIRALAP
jgi:hypothetical protein